MRKVLIIDNSPDFTGAFKSILLVTSAMPSIQFHYCVPVKSKVIKILNDCNAMVFALPFVELQKGVKILTYCPFLLWNSFRVVRYVKRNQISIVHVNDLYNLCGVLTKFFCPSVKLVYHIRLLPSSYAGKLYAFWRKFIVKYADVILCVSNAVRKHWPDNEKIRVLYDAIEQSTLKPRVFHDRHNLRMLYLANYITGKGHQYALEVFKKVQSILKNSEMVFVGGDLGYKKNKMFKDSLMAQVKQEHIQNVVFKGHVKNVAEEIIQADIFLNFSDSESFSMTCLEALYYGTPCIATDSGGPAEIIVNNESGFIVPIGDIGAMVNATLKLATDPELRSKFSVEGQKRVRELFNVEIQAKTLGGIYQK